MAIQLGGSSGSRSKWSWAWPSQGHLFAIYTGVLISLVLGRHYILDSDDPYKCKALINHGAWYGSSTWLPDDCESPGFNRAAIKECAHGGRIVFAGDASVQGLFWAVVGKMNKDKTPERSPGQDLHFKHGSFEVDYFWDPSLNNTQLYTFKDVTKSPIITLIGTGHDFARRNDIDGFEAAINNVVSSSSLTRGTSINYGPHTFDRHDGPGDLLLFAPISPPLEANSTLLASYKSINKRLNQLASQLHLDIVQVFAKMMTGDATQYDADKILSSTMVDHARLDLLLSLRCNGERAARGQVANIRTCCGNWAKPNIVQTAFLACGLALLPLMVIVDFFFPVLASDESRKVVRGTAAFTFGVSLQYLSDRTHLFAQVRRLGPNLPVVYGMMAIVLLSGFVTIRRSKAPKQANTDTRPADQPFLSRDQTEEWKGWMQAFIIMYHYNRGWKIDWLWQIIRVEVASYLFLTGFGHTVYFIQKKDFSFRRVANVMLRTNVLPVALSYVMRTGWQLYYYMPLSTFWFLVIYVTLAIAPGWNDRTPFLLGKMTVSAAAVQCLVNFGTLHRTLFHFFNAVFRMSLKSDEFFGHRTKIDGFIVYVGMLVAIFYMWSKDVLASDKRQDFMARLFRDNFSAIRYAAIALSATIMVAFFYSTNTMLHSQDQWTKLQPYITFIPILTFSVLRNAHPVLRNFYSAFFAWLGRYSGEMYVMQDHLWLAGDQEAILRTGFFAGDGTVAGDRWRDLVLITPLYLIVCSIIGDATGIIATWFIREDKVAKPAPSPPTPAPPTRAQSEVELGLLSHVDGEAGKNGEVGETKHLGSEQSEEARRDSFIQANNTESKDGHVPPAPSRMHNAMVALRQYKVHGRIGVLLLCLWGANWMY